MSLYVADVGVAKIKKELQDKFQMLWDGELDRLMECDEYCNRKWRHEIDNPNLFPGLWCIRCWSHDDEKAEWKGKYITNYENGVFTYGISYNHYGSTGYQARLILDVIFDYFVEEFLERDGWVEPM